MMNVIPRINYYDRIDIFQVKKVMNYKYNVTIVAVIRNLRIVEIKKKNYNLPTN